MTSSAAAGRALASSFEALLRKNLDTKPVERVHQLVQSCVHQIEPGMTLYVLGSTAVYGLHEGNTDVDFVALSAEDVRDGKGADPSTELAKGIQSEFLSRLAAVVRQQDLLWNVDLVRRTRVPVLRVKGGSNHVDFDVTANRRNGVRNSALLRAYFSQLQEARLLSMAVKRWSKEAGINASLESGFLTSYGFNMMVAYYLLRRQLAQFVPPETCDVARIAPVPPYLPLEPLRDDGKRLGELALDFLDFYLEEFKPDTEVISLSRPESTLKESLQWSKQAEDMARIQGEKIHYRWCIEDPFEHNLNVGRHITPFKQMLFRRHLVRARETAFLQLGQMA